MIRFSVCYSNKSGQEFASCGLSEIELDHAMLDNPTALRDKIAGAYQVCEDMVNAQLGTAAVATLPLNPAVARVNQEPPAAAPSTPPPPSMPPAVGPPANGTTFYGNNDGPPKTGKQLGGWAKREGCLPWFERFAAAQKPSPLPKLCSQWTDQWAVYAHGQYMATLQPAPAVPSTNGNGHPSY
jgi:hypothetical protein